MPITPRCASCTKHACYHEPGRILTIDSLPAFCPMRLAPDLVKDSASLYKDRFKELYIQSTINEKNAYQEVRGAIMSVRPRAKEIVEFARLLKVTRVGVAFCIGLKDEATRFTQYLEDQDLTVASVCCKCGGVDKTLLGLREDAKIFRPGGFEAGCNPLTQASLLNEAETGFNIIVGLCVGHDMLFTMSSKAPVTTFIVKDRVLGHNPAMALYSGYHKDVIRKQQST